MKTIVFYISSHGFGHLTRVLSIIERLHEVGGFHFQIVSGAAQTKFARRYLGGRRINIGYHTLNTDVGVLVGQDGSIPDKQKTEQALHPFVASWSSVTASEIRRLEPLNPSVILTDISPVGCLVAGTLGVACIALSNFTWMDVYEDLGMDAPILSAFDRAYQYIDTFYEYALRLPGSHRYGKAVKGARFVSRPIDKDRVEAIRKTYGDFVVITVGQLVSIGKITMKADKDTILATRGVTIASDKVTYLPLDTLDMHNHIAASRFVIAKSGWSTVAEALVAGVPLVLIQRPSDFEARFMIDTLEKLGLAVSVAESNLKCLDIEALNKRIQETIDFEALDRIKNNLHALCEQLMQSFEK